MASQTAQVLLSLNAEEVSSLKEGVNFKKSSAAGKCCIIYKYNNRIKACKNQCKHQGGLFIKDIEDLDGRWEHSDRTHASDYAVSVKLFIPADGLLCFHRTVKCTKHNWKLDVSTMKYVNPPDSFMQDELGKFCHLLQWCNPIDCDGGVWIWCLCVFSISIDSMFRFCQTKQVVWRCLWSPGTDMM